MPPLSKQEIETRRLMANPWVGDKCANADAAMRMSRLFDPPRGGSNRSDHFALSLCLGGRSLLAIGAEFLALLAVQPLGVGFLRAFERSRGARLFGLLFRRSGRRGLCVGRTHQEQGGKGGGRGRAGSDRHHGCTYRIEKKRNLGWRG